MLKSSVRSVIRLRGVRHNNLKNFDLDLPLNQLIVITGLSGSGKSSLAFDTLFAEGQRRYIETFSPYARQFFDRMDKPQVDSIEGIPPAIAIEQRNSVKTTRSTVGTMTELTDYMKMLWPHLAQLHCRQCHQPVRKDSPQAIWSALFTHYALVAPKSDEGGAPAREVLITFDLPLTEKLPLKECLALVSKQGYQRLLIRGEMVRLEEAFSPLPAGELVAPKSDAGGSRLTSLTVIQDRLTLVESNRARFIEACEQAYHFGKGKLAIIELGITHQALAAPKPDAGEPRVIHRFSNRLHCAACDLEYREPSPALFSFNHPVGACPTCRGFGRTISIDYDLALPDRSKTLAEGVVRPWQTGVSAECQDDLMRLCRKHRVPTDVPFKDLAEKWKDFVIEGEPGYGKDPAHQWPRAWYGIKGYFRWLESKSYKMHVRVLLSRYRAYTPCPDCRGKRFQPESLLYRVPEGLTLADFYQLPIRDAFSFIEALGTRSDPKTHSPLGIVLNEVRSRLGYLCEVGLGYLTLDRPTRSLSGGETERVSLTTCLGTRLVNTLFVLDEPSVGLHPRDTDRLVRVLQQLRDAGNTVVVVEHEASVMRAANQLVDLGPGHGATGGEVVFQGAYAEILRSSESLTGRYLSGRRQIELPQRRPVKLAKAAPGSRSMRYESRQGETALLNDAMLVPGHKPEVYHALSLTHATRHNLKDLAVDIPLGRFVCITGVSGSGKTTLAREVLLPALLQQLKSAPQDVKASARLDSEQDGAEEDSNSATCNSRSAMLRGASHLGRVVLVDQSILAKTPRSNPAVYIGAFDDIREVFAQSDVARQRGLNASAFSFNSAQGQCQRCRGAGFEKIEMQFLSDVFIRCPDCKGRRYRSHILEVRIGSKSNAQSLKSWPRPLAAPKSDAGGSRPLSIADLLDSTVEEAIAFLGRFPDSRPAQRAAQSLHLLEEVGLGYLKLGQPINTLSGGESQRLKLVRHLAEAALPQPSTLNPQRQLPTLFLFDEPTTGLHFEDVRVLLKVFQRLVDAGHSVLVIEHNLDVIKCADWLLDLGPDAGDQGGQLVAAGTPEDLAACPDSHTGRALRAVLPPAAPAAKSRQLSIK